ncbi:MAG: transposase, partial [Patescibacteria group bacterium]
MPQSYYRLYYHLIWSTKRRLPIIDNITEPWLKNYIPKKIKKVGKLFTLNMVEDHIHLLVSFPPTISIAEFVHKIK